MRKSNKEILISFVQTLSDKKCKDIYYAIHDMSIPKKDFIEFDKVNLTLEQYSALLELWGKDKLDECIKILNNWLNNITPKKFISHYKMLTGWVDDKYRKKVGVIDRTMSFDKIDTAWKARKYIKNIPKELYPYNADVKFLINKFGNDILN